MAIKKLLLKYGYAKYSAYNKYAYNIERARLMAT